MNIKGKMLNLLMIGIDYGMVTEEQCSEIRPAIRNWSVIQCEKMEGMFTELLNFMKANPPNLENMRYVMKMIIDSTMKTGATKGFAIAIIGHQMLVNKDNIPGLWSAVLSKHG